MSPPLPPRPKKPSYDRFNEDFAKAAHDTLPPAAKKAHSERDIKIAADTQAMANAVTSFQAATNHRFDQVVAQLSALHAHQIEMHVWLTKWTRSPWARLAATAIGSAAGAYAAMKGIQ